MRTLIVTILALTLISVIISEDSKASDDDRYVGIHITVPFTLDGVGTQILARYDNTEYRVGYDSNKHWQIGAGLGIGEDIVYSGGMAYSSFQKNILPYVGIRADYDNDYEAGVVSYGLNQPTTYGFVGFRFEDDGSNNDRNNNGSKQTTNSPEPDLPGDNGGSDGGNGTPPPTNVPGNRSGHGDGTNPGRGGGKTNSPNTGTSNPSANK